MAEMDSLVYGKLGIDIVPDTRGFYRKLRAALEKAEHMYDAQVDVTPDLDRLRDEMRVATDRPYDATISVKADTRKLDRVLKQLRSPSNAIDVKFNAEGIDKARLAERKLRSELDDVNAGYAQQQELVKRAYKTLNDTLPGYVSTVKKIGSNADKEIARIEQSYKAARMRTRKSVFDEQDRIHAARDKDIAQAKRKYQNLVDSYTKRVAKAEKQLDNAVTGKGVKTATDRLDKLTAEMKTSLDKASREYKKTRRQAISDAQRDCEKLAKSLDKQLDVLSKEHDKKLTAAGRQREQQMENAQHEYDQLRAKAQSTVNEALKGAREYRRELGNLNSKLKETTKVSNGIEAGALDQARVIDAMSRSLSGLNDALHGASGFGFDFEGGQHHLVDELDDLHAKLRELERDKTVRFDMKVVEADYRDTVDKVTRVMEKIRDVNSRDARVKFYTDGVERIDATIARFEREGITIPVTFRQELTGLKNRLATEGEKAGASKDFKVDATLNLDVKHAEEKLKKLEDDHKTLNMDLDIKSKLAALHLAELTRPRSVEIFAKLHDTNVGKFINGMTRGATGITYVQRRFDELANTFDRLEEAIPPLATTGSVLATVSAGALNLAGSVGGAAVALGRMSSAALAAPAAVATLGSALAAGVSAVKTFSDHVDVSKTKFKDFQKQLGDSFYGNGLADQLSKLMDSDAAGEVVKGMNSVAAAEGTVFVNMLKIVAAGENVSKLRVIFDNAKSGVENLGKGLDATASAFVTLGDSAASYVPRAAKYLSGLLEEFDHWVETSSNTGRVTLAMNQAIEQAGYLKSSVQSLSGVLTGVFGALSMSENGLEGFAEAAGKADRAVNSIKAQAVFLALRQGAQDAQKQVRSSFSDIADSAYTLRGVLSSTLADAGSVTGSLLSNGAKALAKMAPGLANAADGIRDGLTSMFKAVSENADVFNDLASMVGSVTRAMGTGFNSALRSSAPILKAVAEAAKSVADAFNSLPAPLRDTIVFLGTWGKAFGTFKDTLKSGMVESVQSTLALRSALLNAGVAAENIDTSFGGVVRLYAGMKSGALEAGGALTSTGSTVVKSMESSTVAVGGLRGALKTVGTGAKAAGSALLGAVGGPVGLAVTAGIAAITAGFSAYQDMAAKSAAVNSTIADGFKNVAKQAKSTSEAVNSVSESLKTAMSSSDFNKDNPLESFNKWANKLDVGSELAGFNSASNALKKQKLTMDSLAESAAGTQQAYEKMYKSLTSQADAYQKYADKKMQNDPNYTPEKSDAYEKRIQQMQQLASDYQAVREKALDEAKATAVQNGYTSSYVDKLVKEGEDLRAVAALTQSTAQKKQNEADANAMLAQAIQNVSNARVAEVNAQSSYNQVAGATGAAVAQIKAELGDERLAWDSHTKSIDTSTKAGQDATAMFSNLYAANQSYVQSMIANGEKQSVVNAQVDAYNAKLGELGHSLGLTDTQVEQLQKTYGMTPQEVKTMFTAQTDQAQLNCLNYLNLIQQMFPEGSNSATYQTLLTAITSGAVTDIQTVQNLANTFKDGKYSTVLTADGTHALVPTEIAKSHAELFAAGKDGNGYTTKLNADDLASATVAYASGNAKAFDKLNPHAKLDADDRASSKANKARDAVKSIPGSHNTKITADAGQAMSVLDSVKSAFSSFWSGVTAAFGGGGNKKHKAHGGRIVGPGSSTSDSIPAMLSNGEYVIRAASVRKLEAAYGSGFLNVVNRTGTIPSLSSTYISQAQRQARMPGHYANGGKVTGNVGFGSTVVNNTTFNMPTKVVRANDDLASSAQIMQSSLINKAMTLTR